MCNSYSQFEQSSHRQASSSPTPATVPSEALLSSQPQIQLKSNRKHREQIPSSCRQRFHISHKVRLKANATLHFNKQHAAIIDAKLTPGEIGTLNFHYAEENATLSIHPVFLLLCMQKQWQALKRILFTATVVLEVHKMQGATLRRLTARCCG